MVADQEIDKKVLNETADGLSGNTPIMFATIENKLPFMERMLALGCNINKKNKENYRGNQGHYCAPCAIINSQGYCNVNK